MSFPYGEVDSVAAIMIRVVFQPARQVPGGDASQSQQTESRLFLQVDVLPCVQVVGMCLVQRLNDASTVEPPLVPMRDLALIRHCSGQQDFALFTARR